MPPKYRGRSKEVHSKKSKQWNNFWKSNYSTFKSQNMDKIDAEVIYLVFYKLEEKANYGDVVEVSGDPKREEVRYGEGDLQPETDVMKERELHSRVDAHLIDII
ncbi:hypothetical protein PanWU01x14_213380 [Parasponia andersonii]|uniref:Uncharacterized protein n=1 Tax=Parasponia andersonii TaxID=3476 RepID=A0A2P5BT28_PARAD|nr:hypothetical protein PanWU01x14_213380 [Parasponia andersonii]